jgi:hypothetical protein
VGVVPEVSKAGTGGLVIGTDCAVGRNTFRCLRRHRNVDLAYGVEGAN